MEPAPHPVADALAYLAGTWTVRREVHDRSAGRSGWFTGWAEFRAETDAGTDAGTGARTDAGWLHVEEGVLEWGGARRDARRTLRLLPGADGTAAVAFADGRPFHDLDLADGRWTAWHHCQDDLYEGRFTVVSPDEWRLRWLVRGPAKDQLLDSVYRRAGRPDVARGTDGEPSGPPYA